MVQHSRVGILCVLVLVDAFFAVSAFLLSRGLAACQLTKKLVQTGFLLQCTVATVLLGSCSFSGLLELQFLLECLLKILVSEW